MKKTIFLKYNKNLYPKQAIEEAISSYEEIAKIVFSEQKKYYRIELSGYQRELGGNIGDEFSNHVLSIIAR